MLKLGSLPGEVNDRPAYIMQKPLFSPIVLPMHQKTRIIPTCIRLCMEYSL
jgi:hypothetical protein